MSQIKVRFKDVKTFLAAPEAGREPVEARATGNYEEGLDEEVKQAIAELPESFRLPVLLSAVEDMKYQDISRTLGCPIGTVMSRFYRGRQLLKKRLSGYARAHGYLTAAAANA